MVGQVQPRGDDQSSEREAGELYLNHRAADPLSGNANEAAAAAAAASLPSGPFSLKIDSLRKTLA